MLVSKPYEFKIFKRSSLKFLRITKLAIAGRNSVGQLVLNGRGGARKRFLRLVDFNRFIHNVPAVILRFEYDPNRSCYLMLVLYYNGFFSYLLAPMMVNEGDIIVNNSLVSNKIGSSTSLLNMTIGTFVHCISFSPKNTLKLARAAGTFVTLLKRVGLFVVARLPSKEERFLALNNTAVVGKLSFNFQKIVKNLSAGSMRRRGLKSKVRGVAKNPVDHPHGGGEGRTTAGRPSVSPWGVYTKGVRTSTKRERGHSWMFIRRRNGEFW
jgi:large subunit ribosomal protein L2